MIHSKPTRRVLAIDPNSWGFGFAVLEHPRLLVDWGVTRSEPSEKNRWCLRQLESLIVRYEPDFLAFEDYTAKTSRRCVRVRQFLRAAEKRAVGHGIPSRRLSRARARCRAALAGANGVSKYAIARELVGHYPELASRLPGARKPWMSEDPRMSIFGAVALARALFAPRRAQTAD